MEVLNKWRYSYCRDCHDNCLYKKMIWKTQSLSSVISFSYKQHHIHFTVWQMLFYILISHLKSTWLWRCTYQIRCPSQIRSTYQIIIHKLTFPVTISITTHPTDQISLLHPIELSFCVMISGAMKAGIKLHHV